MMQERSPGRHERDCAWQAHGLALAGLSWGSAGEIPVLALHGWLDNAASFYRLGPLLSGCHVVAPDLTGHGRSARRSADATYQIWDDLPELLAILDQLGWERCILLGHSRGAIIATLLASAFPERVSRLILLDAVAPEAVPQRHFPAQLRKFLLDKANLLERPQRVFTTEQEAVVSRMRHGVDEAAARQLVARSLVPCAGGLTWSTDPRLRGASAVKLTDRQIRAVLTQLSMPTLLLLAELATQTPTSWMEETARQCIANVRVERVAGRHHFHMEASVFDILHPLRQFLDSTDDQDGT